MAEIPCADVATSDQNFRLFLENWETASANWPADWHLTSLRFVEFFREWGCDYLTMESAPAGWQRPFWPPNFGPFFGVNPCVEGGFFYPIKPLVRRLRVRASAPSPLARALNGPVYGPPSRSPAPVHDPLTG